MNPFRRPVIRLSAAYKALLDEARRDLAQLHLAYESRAAERDREAADRDRQIAALRAELDELKAAVRRRLAAEQEVERLRAIRDAATAERDFGQPLH